MSEFVPEGWSAPNSSFDQSAAAASAVDGVQDPAALELMQKILAAAGSRPDLISEKFLAYLEDFIGISSYTGVGVTSSNFLGVFTQAQWPPSADPAIGATAILQDTVNGVDWFLEYRSDLNPTKPWRPYDGDVAPSGHFDWIGAVSGSGGATHFIANGPIVPLAGDWEFDLVAHGDNSAGGSCVPAIQTASGGGSVAASVSCNWATNQGCAEELDSAFTCTKGQQLYFNFSESVGAFTKTVYLMSARFRPVNLENA